MTERKVSSERVSEELSGVAVARLTIEQVAIEAMEHVKDGDSFGSAARNPTTIRTRQLLERLATDALRSSVKTVGPTPDQVLDAANDYAMEQYGMGFLSHPVDRQRILSAIEAPAAEGELPEIERAARSMRDSGDLHLSAIGAPAAANEVTDAMVERGAQALADLEDAPLNNLMMVHAREVLTAALKGDRS